MIIQIMETNSIREYNEEDQEQLGKTKLTKLWKVLAEMEKIEIGNCRKGESCRNCTI